MKTAEESGSSLLAKTKEGEYVSVRSAEGLAVSPSSFADRATDRETAEDRFGRAYEGNLASNGTTFRDSKLGAEVIDSPPSPHLLLKKWQVI